MIPVGSDAEYVIAPPCQPPPYLIEVQLAVEQRWCLDVCEPLRRPAPAQAVTLAALGTLREMGWGVAQRRSQNLCEKGKGREI